MTIMKTTAMRLREITEGCHYDMHEPGEQGISVVVSGHHLDNALGDSPTRNCGEFTVGIRREGWTDGTTWFNLATLIALARVGALAPAYRED